MRSVSVRLEDLKNIVLNLGFAGENEHTRVTVDCKKMYDQYPHASASMTVQPPEGEAYPAVIERDGDYVIWDVTDSDLISEGSGELQLSFTEDPHLAKSYIGRIKVGRSIIPTGEVPEPLDDFLTRAGAALTAIPETINSALAEAKASGEFDGPQGPAGQDGADGQDGFSPVVVVSAITGGHQVSVTDAEGTETFDVMDGIDGVNGQDGRDGTDGADGITPEISIGTVSSGATPAASMDNTDPAHPVLSFTLQKGDKGDTGDAAPAEQVVPAVNAYLASVITNPDSPPLDRSLSSSSAAAPADMVGDLKSAISNVETDVNELLEHETYTESEEGSESTIEYEPVTENSHVNEARTQINGFGTAAISTPSDATVRIYPVEIGKTYKVVGRCVNTIERPLLIVADNVVSSETIALSGNYESVLGSSSTAGVEEKEYTALRTGYMYITATNSDCGVWLKKTITPSEKKYHIDDVLVDVSEMKGNIGLLNSAVFRTKIDSTSAVVKSVPRNAESIAKVTSIDESVTLVRSIIGRNIANVTNVGDVVIDGAGTVKKGFRTVHLPAGNYYIILGNVGNYTMVNKAENGIYTTLYKDQFPMKLTITDPGGGYFIVYASSVANLGDLSGVMIGLLMDDENTLSFEAYSEKTYSPEDLEEDNRIEVIPYGFIEFVNSNGASSVEYTVTGKDDDTTTRKDFITSPDGSKFLPIVKDDGSIVGARVVPKKALFIGNSLTSGWQTFGEAATDSDHDFVAYFSSVVEDMESSYTFIRKWSTNFEQQTSLANAQTWVTNNIDPLLSSDLDLIVVQLCENVVDNASAVATFPESSLWFMRHLRSECPKARVVWMGLWFERRWVKTLLENTAKAGVEYIDIRPLYKTENVSVIGTIYKMDSDYEKSYTVDSFTISGGEISMTFTVDGVQYSATIPSYTSYTSSGDTQITVTGIYHVVNTYYASIHPGDEGFRKIANKLLFDLGISDNEETIPADE